MNTNSYRNYMNLIILYIKDHGLIRTMNDAFCYIFFRIITIFPFAKNIFKWLTRLHKGLTHKNINICFFIGGGFGDFLIFANYVWYFLKYFNDSRIKIDVYFAGGFGTSKSLFEEGKLIRKLYKRENEYIYQSYDVFFELSRYPRIKYFNKSKIIKKKSLPLFEYIQICKKFEYENPRFFCGAENDGQSAIFSLYAGQKRLQQPDIYRFFGIKESYYYPLFINANEDSFLKSFHLTSKKFITMHRGCDANYPTHVKMWSVENYGILAKMIKLEFPEIIIVQYGISEKRCPPIENVDVNLVGKTSMEEVKILLKNSLVHIDSDGGMVHLRHALHGGPSIAMYGPNWQPFFGYSENINITGTGCSHFCDWLTNDWMIHCARNCDVPPCMASITPEQIMEAFRKFMNSGVK